MYAHKHSTPPFKVERESSSSSSLRMAVVVVVLSPVVTSMQVVMVMQHGLHAWYPSPAGHHAASFIASSSRSADPNLLLE
jgi:heme/copper-type cytochrome/quinol oxidase subunit 4